MSSKIEKRRRKAQAMHRTSYERRRAEVLRAAAKVFSDRGFSNTSLAEVAAELELDRASLYYYVGGKNELFRDVVLGALQTISARAQEIAESRAPAPERLRTMVVELLESYAEHYPFLFVFLQENLDHIASGDESWTHEVRRAEQEHFTAVEATVRAGMEDRSIRDVAPPWLVTRAVLGMAASTSRWFVPDEEGIEAARLGDLYCDILLAGLSDGDHPELDEAVVG